MIKVYHLEYSRSTRILWLLEEMGVPYEMERFSRDAVTFRSGDDLSAVHPLGKAPTVLVDDRVMVESGAIIEYLIEAYGNGNLAPAPGTGAERAAYLEWLHFAEGTLGMPVLMMLLGPRFGGLGDIMGGFMGAEVKKLLGYIQGVLDTREFLVGDSLTGADINIWYMLELANGIGLLEPYPAVKAYRNRLVARPAYVKAIELGGAVLPPFAG